MLPLESYFYKRLINELSQLNMDAALVKKAVISTLLILLVMFIHISCWRVFNFIKVKTAGDVKINIVNHAFEYTHKHSFNFFQNNFSGTITKNITALSDKIESLVYDYASPNIRGVSQIITALILMYFVHPIFALALFTWIVIFTVGSTVFVNRITYLSDEYAASQSLVTGELVDSIGNFSNVKIFGANRYETSYLQKALNNLKTKFIAKEWFLTKLWICQSIAWILLFGFMLFMLLRLKLNNQITIGDFVLIFTLTNYVADNVWWLTETMGQINEAIGTSKQSLRAIYTATDINDKADAKSLEVTQGIIEFDKVHFQYHGNEQIFQNKSIVIKPGSKVGLVGYSGSGKSTFVHLILRLYDITDGAIRIDNQDIRDVNQNSLHENIGMIPQDPSLFHRSLMENIRYGRTNASDEEVIAAAVKAHAHEFIEKLPLKYASLVGERGIKLSGGQRQRIAIARVILKNAPILILDEATSALDSVVEKEIQESLLELMSQKTTIVIAHRLSTLLKMDRILVFDNGVIVEDGTHNDLLKRNGLYKTLWDAQVGGFLPDKGSEE